jgi:hypothetical protein
MGTSGALYVPQVVLTLLLPDGVSLNVYCILHLALAATGSYLLARHQGCSRAGATVAGLGYGFCGSVLLQIYNPIYAAGAAWLVWGVYGGLRLLGGGGVLDGLLLAVSLALSVYCGDPQSGYHAGLVLGLFWLLMPGRSWRGLGALAAAGAAGAMLALVQVAVTAEFMRETTRGVQFAPRSLWEVPAHLWRTAGEAGMPWYAGLLGRLPAADGHYRTMYDFSLHPWRLLELAWADFSGTTFYRWPVMLGIDSPGAWVTSLYAGVVPCVATLVGMRLTRVATGRSWTVTAALALLASLGGMGLVGLVRNGAVIAAGRWGEFGYHPGDEVGGLYWALATLLPGYASFRYPAKWMTVFALACAQLAGLGMTSGDDEHAAGRWWRPLAAVGTAAAVGLATVLGAAAVVGWGNVLPGSVGDPRRPLALAAVVQGGIQTVIVAALAAGVMCRRPAAAWAGCPASLPVALLALITAADLVTAGRRGLVVAPFSTLVSSSGYLESLAATRLPELAATSTRPRLYVQAPVPKFADQRQPERFVRYTGVMLRSHVPWLHGYGVYGESSTAMPADVAELCRPRRIDGRWIPPRRAYDLAGVEYFIVSLEGLRAGTLRAAFSDWSPEQKQGRYAGPRAVGDPLPLVDLPLPGEEHEPPVAVVIRNPSALPRARIVHDFDAVPRASAAADRQQLLERIALPSRETPDLVHRALVEAPRDVVVAAAETAGATAAGGGPPPAGDAVRMVVDEPRRVVCDAELTAPGLLVLADTFHPDWQATLVVVGAAARPLETFRANGIHRAVSLPAGRWRVEFRHRCAIFDRTLPVTAAAWAVAVGAAVVAARRAGRRPRREA